MEQSVSDEEAQAPNTCEKRTLEVIVHTGTYSKIGKRQYVKANL